MSDQSPEPDDKKQALVAPFIIGGVMVLLLVLAFFPHGVEKSTPLDAKSDHPTATPKPVPLPQALSRRDLIKYARLARATYSDGGNAALPVLRLSGRNFTLRVPFGCNGPQLDSESAQTAVEYQSAKSALKLSARPADWTDLPIVSQTKFAPEIEKVEGFWLPRPWSYSDACPPARNELSIATLAPAFEQTLGIAQIFKKDESRLFRRDGRPYEFVRKIQKDDPEAFSRPYFLVLEGRVGEFENGVSVKCHSVNPEQRPVCLYAVGFERVAFETANGDNLAEWRK